MNMRIRAVGEKNIGNFQLIDFESRALEPVINYIRLATEFLNHLASIQGESITVSNVNIELLERAVYAYGRVRFLRNNIDGFRYLNQAAQELFSQAEKLNNKIELVLKELAIGSNLVSSFS